MKLSIEKRDKISEQILYFLYNNFPQARFTAEIARDLARDEEFIKSLMFDLQNKALVIPVKKNFKGKVYSRRIRWRLSNKAHLAYKSAI